MATRRIIRAMQIADATTDFMTAHLMLHPTMLAKTGIRADTMAAAAIVAVDAEMVVAAEAGSDFSQDASRSQVLRVVQCAAKILGDVTLRVAGKVIPAVV